jgi:hypothetical protein
MYVSVKQGGLVTGVTVTGVFIVRSIQTAIQMQYVDFIGLKHRYIL